MHERPDRAALFVGGLGRAWCLIIESTSGGWRTVRALLRFKAAIVVVFTGERLL